MSPHNYELKFNGSYKNSNVKDQHDLADKFDMFLSTIGSFLYTISGLRFFYTRRIFTRGTLKDKPFPEEWKNIPLNKQKIEPFNGMMLHPSYQKKSSNSSPYAGGTKV